MRNQKCFFNERLSPILISVAITVFSIISSCEKPEVPRDTPDCIKQKIAEIKSAPVRNPPAQVWKANYEGKVVYYISPYCCDIYGQLYDQNCNLICHPDGGIAGSGDGQCPDFFNTRTNAVIIWKDSRTYP